MFNIGKGVVPGGEGVVPGGEGVVPGGEGVVPSGERVVPGEVQQTLIIYYRGFKHFFTYPGWPCVNH